MSCRNVTISCLQRVGMLHGLNGLQLRHRHVLFGDEVEGGATVNDELAIWANIFLFVFRSFLLPFTGYCPFASSATNG